VFAQVSLLDGYLLPYAEIVPTVDTLAVPIEQIVAEQGIQIARNYHSHNHVSGFAYQEGTYRIIGVNTATSPRRQRFAIAHAYGHLELHRKVLVSCYQIQVEPRRPGSSEPTPEMESQANRFAADLLMPEESLRAELARKVAVLHDSRDQLIMRMAAAFEVSNEAMGWRLISLSLITG
jgi:Zn-dependent peptidase ImmA (M78 family)